MGAQFLFLVAIAGRKFEVLQADGLVFAILHLVDEFFLLFDFLRSSYINKVYTRAGFVQGIDGLVGEEAVGDVSVCQFDTRFEGRIGIGHVVMVFVTVLDVAQDLERFFRCGRLHDDFLETAFQGTVLLDALAILVEGSGADALDFATG